MKSVDLGKYDNSHYYPGAGKIKRAVWYMINAFIFHSWLMPHSGFKCLILRWFGAKVGINVNIKPRVNIKYPWNIVIDDNVWLGEGCWLDSLAKIKIGSNVCISQEAYLLTGNHDYKDPNFGLVTKEILIEDGVWIGARAIVCPGVYMRSHSILTVGSIMSGNAEQAGIYRGNPAQFVRQRVMQA